MNVNYFKVSLNQLLLDPNNYRLDHDSVPSVCTDVQINTQEKQEETQALLEKEKIGELRESMLENGFLEMDRIVVRRLEGNDTKYVVVEGNRRTAAFKGLISDHREGIRSIPEHLIDSARAINVVCIEGEKADVNRYSSALMGIRHVSGPKRWSGYQSARLINDRIEEGDSLTTVGSLLGISAIEAGRRQRGYKAFIQMKKDKVYGKKCTKNHYTLLLEFLGATQPGREWLGWDEKEKVFTNKKNRDRLYSALIKKDDKRAEISNPTEARQFQKFLSSKEHRKMIENRMVIQDLPPLSQDGLSRQKQIKDFLYLLDNVDVSTLVDEEVDALKKISVRSEAIYSEIVGND